MVDPHQYRVFVEPLSSELGGGFVAYAPGLTGCISDGESPNEALVNVYDAVRCWVEAAMLAGETIPAPDALRRVA